jgi:hypothetical protein
MSGSRMGNRPAMRQTLYLCSSGKATYMSPAKARRVIPKMQGGNKADEFAGKRLRPYECRLCGHWHLTSQDSRRGD